LLRLLAGRVHIFNILNYKNFKFIFNVGNFS